MIIPINIPLKKMLKIYYLSIALIMNVLQNSSCNKLTQTFTINETEHIQYEKHI